MIYILTAALISFPVRHSLPPLFHRQILFIFPRRVTIQYLHSYVQNPFQISFADGIFAFQPMFSYGQRSKCADLLNSYPAGTYLSHPTSPDLCITFVYYAIFFHKSVFYA